MQSIWIVIVARVLHRKMQQMQQHGEQQVQAHHSKQRPEELLTDWLAMCVQTGPTLLAIQQYNVQHVLHQKQDGQNAVEPVGVHMQIVKKPRQVQQSTVIAVVVC
jgi:hypothetical protein